MKEVIRHSQEKDELQASSKDSHCAGFNNVYNEGCTEGQSIF